MAKKTKKYDVHVYAKEKEMTPTVGMELENGAILLAAKKLPAGSVDRKDLYVVLADSGEGTAQRYVTWLLWASDGSCHEGHYSDSIAAAATEFEARK